MLIPSFAFFHQSIANNSSINDFVQEKQLVISNEQLESQEHRRMRRQPTTSQMWNCWAQTTLITCPY